MKRKFMTLFTTLSLIFLASCDDSGRGSLSNRSGYDFYEASGFKNATFEEIAAQFALEVNSSVTGFQLVLAKAITAKESYAVFECEGNGCSGSGDYLAINLQNYIPGQWYKNGKSYSSSAWQHLKDTNSYDLNYHDVDYIGGGLYQDYYTGVIFEKTAGSAKDLAKLNAIAEEYSTFATAENISEKFGFSMKRSLEIAKLNTQWNKHSKKSMTRTEIDSYATEILGFSLTEGTKAFKKSMEGDSTDIKNLVDTAAQTNGVSPEQIQKIMVKYFGL